MKTINIPPAHPGEILRKEYIEALALSITDAAKGLKIARTNLSAIVNCRAGISPEMAIKLSEAFGTSARYWLELQQTYDLWLAEQCVDRSEIMHFYQPNNYAK